MPSGWVELPEWLVVPVSSVLADIQGDDPIPYLRVLALEIEQSDGMLLGVFEPDGTGGGGSVGVGVSPLTDPLQMILTIAEVLQEECAETASGWGKHAHPARITPTQRVPPHTEAKPGGCANDATSGSTDRTRRSPRGRSHQERPQATSSPSPVALVRPRGIRAQGSTRLRDHDNPAFSDDLRSRERDSSSPNAATSSDQSSSQTMLVAETATASV